MRAKAHGFGFLVSTFLALFLCMKGAHAAATSIDASQSSNEGAVNSESINKSIHRTWQIGGFVAGGFPPYYTVHAPLLHYQEDLRFYDAGLEAGRIVTAIHGPKLLRGRGEAVVELIPYWQVSHPAQTVAVYLPGNSAPSFLGHAAAYSIHGASITPLQFRWNFLKKDTSRFVPWIQPGIGLLWTNQDFPQGYGDAAKPPVVRTSHINFTPQLDLGENIFVHKNQSIDLSVQAIRITNFGLTTYDPGVNIIVEFRVGYSWWR
jgi:lipid A 3-O-deacylase